MKRYAWLLLLLGLCSCANEEAESPLRPYYEESCHLSSANLDSICSFSEKFYLFTRDGSYDKDPLYRPTVDNIESSKANSLLFDLTFQTEWEGEIIYNY